MSSQNDHRSYSREIKEEAYSSNPDANTHTNIKQTTETVTKDPKAYQSGYTHGRISERDYQERNLEVRDRNNTANGFIIGLLLTLITLLTGGAIWLFYNQNNQPLENNPQPVNSPVTNTQPSPEPSQAPQNRTTIIERTREVAVPVPVPQSQQPQQSSPQDININVPKESSSQPNSTTQQSPPTYSPSGDSSSSSTNQSQEVTKSENSSSDADATNTSESTQ